jgi:hypothetical protein
MRHEFCDHRIVMDRDLAAFLHAGVVAHRDAVMARFRGRAVLPTNVDMVIVDGRILRRGGKFIAFDHAEIVAEAREAAIGLRDKAKWPI